MAHVHLLLPHDPTASSPSSHTVVVCEWMVNKAGNRFVQQFVLSQAKEEAKLGTYDSMRLLRLMLMVFTSIHLKKLQSNLPRASKFY